MVLGGAKPVNGSLKLGTYDALKSEYFLERREIGIINVAGAGKVVADGETYEVEKLSCVYLGKGTKEVIFSSDDAQDPACFFLLSSPAHHTFENKMFTKEEVQRIKREFWITFADVHPRKWILYNTKIKDDYQPLKSR